MSRRFDHIDLRVRDLAAAEPFYRKLLPLLGFTRDMTIEGWVQYESGTEGADEFFGVTEDPDHEPNRTRVAFRAQSVVEVDGLSGALHGLGARNIEEPGEEVPGYYAVFFEDAEGNRFEICHRDHGASES